MCNFLNFLTSAPSAWGLLMVQTHGDHRLQYLDYQFGVIYLLHTKLENNIYFAY
jgi:hypothetical protein